MIAVNICRMYPGTTLLDIERMTLDQVGVYCRGGESKQGDGNVEFKSPGELASMGVIAAEGGRSLAQILEQEQAERAAAERLRTKLERRRAKETGHA